MSENQDLFHILKTNRPMRRLKPDPVPQVLLQEILDAASCAPNSMNTQPYEILNSDSTREGWSVNISLH